MKIFKHKKAFTLIEILIVIAIIGVLATIIVISFMNAQAKARDNKRRADVQAIASAHQLLHLDIDTHEWFIRGTGLNSMGVGWFNYEGGVYPLSIAHGLENGHYIDVAPRDPLMQNDNDLTANHHYRVYRRKPNNDAVAITARLENPTALEIQDAADALLTKPDGSFFYYSTSMQYNINYVVVVK